MNLGSLSDTIVYGVPCSRKISFTYNLTTTSENGPISSIYPLLPKSYPSSLLILVILSQSPLLYGPTSTLVSLVAATFHRSFFLSLRTVGMLNTAPQTERYLSSNLATSKYDVDHGTFCSYQDVQLNMNDVAPSVLLLSSTSEHRANLNTLTPHGLQ